MYFLRNTIIDYYYTDFMDNISLFGSRFLQKNIIESCLPSSILLINIMSKRIFKAKQIFFSFLCHQVASISTHTFLKEANDQFWSFKNRNSTASNFIGHEYPLPINIQPNYHNKVVDFLDYQGQKKGYKRFAITLDESGVPIDAFVIALLCRTNKYICTLPYNARSKLLLGTYDNKNKFREDFILLKNEFLENRYDAFF